MGLVGIFLALGMLIALAYRGWSILLLAPGAALLVAAFSREPLLAHWTQTLMSSTAQFIGQFFPLFLLGALFGKLMVTSTGWVALSVLAFTGAALGHSLIGGYEQPVFLAVLAAAVVFEVGWRLARGSNAIGCGGGSGSIGCGGGSGSIGRGARGRITN